MTNQWIKVRGAKAHNLKNIDIDIPKNQFVVITGLSGSGKSSLAFDTIYAEGQRRYVESLSSYARQFLGQMDKADVDSIEGLSPAISIDQKTTSKNPRSTVGTVTEINDYLRLLYSRCGHPYCPHDHIEIQSQSPEQMTDQLLSYDLGTKLQLLAPVVRGKKGTHKEILNQLQKEGYVRCYIDQQLYELDDVPELNKNQNHDIDVVVDRIKLKDGIRSRLFDGIETALQLSEGYLKVDFLGAQPPLMLSEHYACPHCGFSVGELEPRLFSFNSPFGACPSCDGLGQKLEVDEELVIPDQNKTLQEGAIVPWNPISSSYYMDLLTAACETFKIPMDKPFKKLTKRQKEIILHGNDKKTITFDHVNERRNTKREVKTYFEGVIPNIYRRYHETTSDFIREQMSQYMTELPCSECHGYRLNQEALSVKINGINIGEFNDFSIEQALDFIERLSLSAKEKTIARPILKEIHDRLTFLKNVGLNYLTLSRSAGTLSGGEAQRIRLATQIGSNLSGVLYVLDEPSIGLHQRDNDRLLMSLKQMRDLDNTLIVVEHDEDTMRAADYLIDIGPYAGKHGGQVVAAGTVEEVMDNEDSLTGRYLSGKEQIAVPKTRRQGNGSILSVKGACENNLKEIDVDFPLGTFIAVTGVSGSGKSTLVNQVLKKAIAQKLNHNSEKPGRHRTIEGIEHIEKIIDIDQSPIGRTPRSNPATYTSVFDDIRELFAATNEAKLRGYKKGRFSFNVKGGRCEACRGDGIIKIEMHFLPDVYVPCEVCHGTRYNSETLEVKYKGKTIDDVLNMTVEEALVFFEAIPKIKRKLQTIVDVGLGYVTLGQSATTLSGGEAQRMKLASELHKKSRGKNLYILDEPTTGLHLEDVKRLLLMLQRLVDQGNTVIVIEHNLDVIKSVDYIIDLGPEGGDKGGQIVAIGTPESVSQVKESYTGQYLKNMLK